MNTTGSVARFGPVGFRIMAALVAVGLWMFSGWMTLQADAPSGGRASRFREPNALRSPVTAPGAVFRWFHDGQPIPLATNATLVLGPFHPAQAGEYRVSVDSGQGPVLGDPAFLSLDPASPAQGGAVVAWGSGVAGIRRPPPAADTHVIAVSCGTGFALALRLDGTVVAWGDSRLPVLQVPAAIQGRVHDVAAGASHAIALLDDGTVAAWGKNDVGQTSIPPQIVGGIASVSAGFTTSAVLTVNGDVIYWGALRPPAGVLYAGGVSPVVAVTQTISDRGNNLYAVDRNGGMRTGSASAWFSISAPGLTNSTSTRWAGGNVLSLQSSGDIGYAIKALFAPEIPEDGAHGIVAIAAGRDHFLSLKSDGSAHAFGGNASRQSVVPEFVGTNAFGVAAGDELSFAVIRPTPVTLTALPSDTQWIEGQPAFLRARGTGAPIRYKWFQKGVEIRGATGSTLNLGRARLEFAGDYSVVVWNSVSAVTSSVPARCVVIPAPRSLSPVTPGRVIAWGAKGNDFGQANVPVEAQSGVIGVAAGASHSLALRADGTVVAWGSDTNVPGEAKLDVAWVGAGYQTSLATKRDGTLLIWGTNNSNLGNIPMDAGSDVIAAADDGSYMIALKSDGSTVVWGGSSKKVWPVPAPAQTDVVAVDASFYGLVAVTRDGRCVMWSAESTNLYKMPQATQDGAVAVSIAHSTQGIVLRDGGSAVSWSLPIGPVSSLPLDQRRRLVSVATGLEFSLFLRDDGLLIPAGTDGSHAGVLLPPERTGVISIAAGEQHGLAIVAPGAPQILQAPASVEPPTGTQTHLSVAAVGAQLAYQWFHDGVAIPNATGSTLNLGPARDSVAGNYVVQVSNSEGVVSNAVPASVAIRPRPTGSLVVWGRGGVIVDKIPVSERDGWSQLCLGINHLLAVSPEGRLKQWRLDPFWFGGRPEFPQGDTTTGVVSISGGWLTSGFINQRGGAELWGDINQTIEPDPTSGVVMQLVVDDLNPFALRENGTVVNIGNRVQMPAAMSTNVAQVAGGSLRQSGQAVVRRDGAAMVVNGGVPQEASSDVVELAIGERYRYFALRTDGSVVGWNQAYPGLAGLPAEMEAGVVSVAAGAGAVLALKFDGTLVGWNFGFGALPIPSEARFGVLAIAMGEDYAAALVDTTAPKLSVTEVSTGVRLSWRSNSAGFHLQKSKNLSDPDGWTDFMAAPESDGSNSTLVVPAAATQSFFRLIR